VDKILSYYCNIQKSELDKRFVTDNTKLIQRINK